MTNHTKIIVARSRSFLPFPTLEIMARAPISKLFQEAWTRS